MAIADVRKDLEAIRAYAKAGDLSHVVQTVEQALHTLDAPRLLTTTEAAALLGVRSVNTLKLLIRRSGLPYETHGNRMMIPMSTLEQLQDSAMVRGIRASDRAHDATSELGTESGLTQVELDTLEQSRPGRLPWKANGDSDVRPEGL
ncbi:MAG TPA: helix-turn-helix domain-containing protein [Ktedonobacterales bacterium]|nr:helix-turn-helix domain-containing protein [Ktedonobacterales bacterium]